MVLAIYEIQSQIRGHNTRNTATATKKFLTSKNITPGTPPIMVGLVFMDFHPGYPAQSHQLTKLNYCYLLPEATKLKILRKKYKMFIMTSFVSFCAYVHKETTVNFKEKSN